MIMINDFVKAVKIKNKFSMVGHSFGGYLTGLYAYTYPEKI